MGFGDEALGEEPPLLRVLAHHALAHLRQAEVAPFRGARSRFQVRRRSWDRGGRGVGSLFPTGLRCSGGRGSHGERVWDREIATKAVSSTANVQICSRFPLSKRKPRLFNSHHYTIYPKLMKSDRQLRTASGRLVITETTVRGKQSVTRG